MIVSAPFACTYQGKPATMRVIRNDGECWGRLTQGDSSFDVSSRTDHYDSCDDEAAAAFARASQWPARISTALREI